MVLSLWLSPLWCFAQSATQGAIVQTEEQIRAEFTNFPSAAEALQPDPAYQKVIADLLEPLRYPTAKIDESLRKQRLEKCRQLFEKDEPKLIRQAIVYSVTPVPQTDPAEHAYSVLAVMELLGQTGNRNLLILAMIPLLDAKDPKIQTYVQLFRGQFESFTNQPSLDAYVKFLSFYDNKKFSPPRELIVYLLHRAPGEAVLVMDASFRTNAALRRQLRWTEHVVSDFLWKKENNRLSGDAEMNLANKELENLFGLDSCPWWARLYVAEILDGHAELRTQKLVEQIKKDTDAALKAIGEKWQPGK